MTRPVLELNLSGRDLSRSDVVKAVCTNTFIAYNSYAEGRNQWYYNQQRPDSSILEGEELSYKLLEPLKEYKQE